MFRLTKYQNRCFHVNVLDSLHFSVTTPIISAPLYLGYSLEIEAVQELETYITVYTNSIATLLQIINKSVPLRLKANLMVLPWLKGPIKQPADRVVLILQPHLILWSADRLPRATVQIGCRAISQLRLLSQLRSSYTLLTSADNTIATTDVTVLLTALY